MASSSDSIGAGRAIPTGALHPIATTRLSGIPGRPDPLAVGVIIWLASELMFFAAIFAAYFNMRNIHAAAGTGGWTPAEWLDVPKAVLVTAVLVLSSVTCQLGVHAAEHGRVSRTGALTNIGGWGMREWYTLTFVMGAFFLSGQVMEYATLYSDGLTPQAYAYGSVFFFGTGFHALHVLGGLVAFLFVLARTYFARTFTHEQAVSAVAISYYWHFVDVVWIILFSVIYFLH